MDLANILAAPVWIVVIAVIWTTARSVKARLAPEARIAIPFGLDFGGRVTLRRDAAFILAVGGPIIVGFALMAAAEFWPRAPYEAVIMLGVRVSVALALALLHLAWLKRLMRPAP